MRILLAVDNSPHSTAAVEEVLRRKWPAETIVRVLSVVPAVHPAATEVWFVGLADVDAAEQELAKHARDLAARTADRLRQSGLAAEPIVERGDPRTEIIDQATSWHADLVILGSHGYTGIQRLLLGSVAQYVVSHAPCSVEVVRSKSTTARENQ